MRILVISSVFPPNIIGGAELSAYNLALWLSRRGHDVAILTVAQNGSQETHGEMADGLRVWRLRWPRSYTQYEHKQQTPLQKWIWHLQDHLDPRNSAIVRSIIEQFSPEVVNIQLAQGVGHNILSALTPFPHIRVLYVLHDLTLACVRTSMFKNGKNCEKQCAGCKISSLHKMSFFRGKKNVHFVSPSRSNLETLSSILDLSEFPCSVIPNLDLAESAVANRKDNHQLKPARFIYAGRLDSVKGIDFLLAVLDSLFRDGHRFTMVVVGDGPLREQIESDFGSREWLTLTGQVAPDRVSLFLREADMLLFPSVWREVLGNVILEALRVGVPAIVSDIGGPKEVIENDVNGLVVKAGSASAWKAAIQKVLTDDNLLLNLQANAEKTSGSYSADELGQQFLSLFSSPQPS
jgi:glycosyltransferase involved in cell wall biosynthesis